VSPYPYSLLFPRLVSFHLADVGLDPGGITCRRDSETQVSQKLSKSQIKWL